MPTRAPLDHVTIHHGDTAVVKQGIGTFGSRSQAVGGAALHDAGAKVKAKMAKFAAALLAAHESDLVFENGAIAVKGAPASAKRFAEVAAYAYQPIRLPEGLTPGLSDEAFFEPQNHTYYPFGCHIAMLEIDPETGEPRLLRMVAVDDAGHLINPLIVEGQIHGGLAQGIGQAMIEEVAYAADGQPLTASFMDYALARASDFPRFELDRTVAPTPVNALGAKGVGEAGTIGSAPCIVIELQRVSDSRHLFRITAKDLDTRARLRGHVPLAEQIVGRRASRAGAAGDELDVHPAASLRIGPAARSPARWRPGGR